MNRSGGWFPVEIIIEAANKTLDVMEERRQKRISVLIDRVIKEQADGIFGFKSKNVSREEALDILKRPAVELGSIQEAYIWAMEKDEDETVVQQIRDMAKLSHRYCRTEVFITRDDLHLIYKWCE